MLEGSGVAQAVGCGYQFWELGGNRECGQLSRKYRDMLAYDSRFWRSQRGLSGVL